MKDKITYMFIGIGIGIGLIIALIITTLVSVDRSYMESTAIENGCGEYNTTTSEFQWINIKGL